MYMRQHPDTKLEDLVIYTTTQTHSLGSKAALVLGLAARSLEVTAEDNYRLRGDTLRKALEEDHRTGKKPFILSEFGSHAVEIFKTCSYHFRSCYGGNHVIRSCRRST